MRPQCELQGLLADQHLRDIALHSQEPGGRTRTSGDVGCAVKNNGELGLSGAAEHAVSAFEADDSRQKTFIAHGVIYMDAAAAPHTESNLQEIHR